MSTTLKLQLQLTFTFTSPTKPSPPATSLPLPTPTPHPLKPQTLLQTHAPAKPHLSGDLQEKILCLELLGIDAGKALAQNPPLLTTPLAHLHSVIAFLRSKTGLRHSDLPKILGMCPTILTASISDDLTPALQFLTADLSVPAHRLRHVIAKNPRLLACSVRDQLKPALAFLRRLGFVDLDALACRDSVLLVSSVEKTLLPKLRFLEGLGISRAEAVAMVLRCPALFTFSVENNFKPKFGYFSGEMGRELAELREFPQYFAFSLENRIKPRYGEVVRWGLEGVIGLPAMLKSTDEEFAELVRQAKGVDRGLSV